MLSHTSLAPFVFISVLRPPSLKSIPSFVIRSWRTGVTFVLEDVTATGVIFNVSLALLKFVTYIKLLGSSGSWK